MSPAEEGPDVELTEMMKINLVILEAIHLLQNHHNNMMYQEQERVFPSLF